MKFRNVLIKNIFIIILLLTSSGCNADNATLNSLTGAFKIERDFILDAYVKGQDGYDINKPQVIIESLTSIKCSNTVIDKASIHWEHCYVTNDPLPKEITFRYGTWISRQDEDRLYPEPPPFRPMSDNEDHRDYNSSEDTYYEAMYKLPKYKKIEEARQESIEKIDWHTYTIYPQQLMDEYKYKIPEGKKWYRITPYSWSTKLWVKLVVQPDMSVIVEKDYRFFYSGNGSWN